MKRGTWVVRLVASTICVGCLFGGIAQPEPSTQSVNKQSPAEQPKTQKSEGETNGRENDSTRSPISIVVSPTLTAENRRDDGAHVADEKSSGNSALEILSTVINVLATAVVAIFTWRLSVSTRRLWEEAIASSRTTRDVASGIGNIAEAMISNTILLKSTVETNRQIAERQKLASEWQLRAFVSSRSIGWQRRPSQAGGSTEYLYYFFFQWSNAGNTPTKNMQTFVQFLLRDTPLPDDFAYPHGPYGTSRIPPHDSITSPLIPSTGVKAVDLAEVGAGKKFAYIWGYAKYFDVIPGTSEHVTKFCCQVRVNGDPVNPGSDMKGVDFIFPFHHHHNCADDECGQD